MPRRGGQGGGATRILLATKDNAVVDLVSGMLCAAGTSFDVDHVADLHEASARLSQSAWHVCLVDTALDPGDVPAAIAKLAHASIATPIIILGGPETTAHAGELESAGAADVLERSRLTAPVLEMSIHYALKNQSFRDNLRTSNDELVKQLLGAQQAIQQLRTKNEEHATLVEHLAEARDRAESSESRYRTLAERSPVGIWQIGLDGATQYMNPAMHRLLELDEQAEVVGEDHRTMLTDEAQQAFSAVRDRWLKGKSASCEIELIGRRSLNVAHGFVSGGILSSGDGEVRALLATVADITERKQVEEKIRHLAGHDALTGLPNRALFQDRLGQALATAERNGKQVAVLFLDLDHFKDVNDTLGHPAGDQLLVKVAERLLDCARRSDTVARFGGDEFAIIAAGADQPRGATMLAARVIESLRRPYVIDGQQLRLGTSIGITVAPVDGSDPDKLLRNADLALYRAKDHERGTHEFFDVRMDTEIRIRKSLESDLGEALERQQLSLHFQAQIDVRTGKPSCAEVLLRWTHPTRGQVPPSEFIPVAESTGAIVPIGEWVLRTACGEVKRWQQHGLPRLPVAVNMSPVQFRQRTLVAAVSQILNDMSLAPSLLELEVTEGMLMDDNAQMTRRLQQLRSLGVGLSIDDFGTGYSSLAYLKRFPADKLKIDQSFIRDISQDGSDAAIARTVIHLAHSLNMQVTAEGVETPEQLEFLRSHNCDYVQGYLLCRPMPATLFAQWLCRYADQPAAAADAIRASGEADGYADASPPFNAVLASS